MTTVQHPEPRELDLVRSALASDYDVLEELGRGGMAVVYRAHDRQLGRDVAIKVLPFSLAFDGDFVARFEREARTSAQLEHPHIVPVYRVGRTGQVIYFVMKFLRGRSLSARLAAEGALPVADVRRMLVETAAALGYAARRGVVHRDVKPDNIMLDEDGRAVVTDFGIARSAADSKLTATGMSVGTPRYMSPEQARSKPLDGRSDIYSLGVVGYECLTGRTPFDGDDAFAILMEHINTPVPTPVLATPEARALFAVVERMLAKRPEDRFADADALIAALTGDAVVAPSTLGQAARSSGETTRETVHDTTRYSAPESAPRSSAALDAAFDAGMQLLKQQRPKVDAGLAAGRRFAESQAPRVRSAGGRVARLTASAARTIGRAAESLTREGMRAAGTGRVYASTKGRRFWINSAAAMMACLTTYYGVHFAIKHRSHCPAVSAVSSGVDSGSGPASTKAHALALRVDDIGSNGHGSDLDVYYDVCGLDAGTTFETRVSVTKNESGFRRLLGDGVGPVSASFDEEASGPATRRHRTLALSEMPTGSYTLLVAITDAKGRRREKDVAFQIVK